MSMKEFMFIMMTMAIFTSFSCSNGNEKMDAEKDEGKSAVSVVWTIDNLTSIAGYTTTVLGSPQLIETPKGKAVEFDGVQDALIVDKHPLEGVSTFTLEVIFRPDAGGLPEQRFFHLQENDTENRILIETRLTDDNQWFLDTYIKSNETDQTLIDKTFTHPVGEWYNATLIFDGREMRHYVNGTRELSAEILSFTPPKEGKTSIGVRINQVYWFKGALQKARFTKGVLTPEEFLKP